MKLEFKPYDTGIWKKIVGDLMSFIRQEVKNQNKSGVMLGISGGIDSAVVAALSVKALGCNKVKGIILPDTDSDSSTVEDAQLLVKHLKLNDVKIIDITPKLKAFGTYDLFPDVYSLDKEERTLIVKQKFKKLNNTMNINDNLLEIYRNGINKELRYVKALWTSKVRMRLMCIYFYAECNNLLVLGTTNKTEYDLGWFTKYGDAAVDAEVLLPFYKTRVFELAKYLKIPEKIITKTPSADILPEFSDETNLGLTYEVVDKVLLGINNYMSEDDILSQLHISKNTLQRIKNLMESSRYNRIVPIKNKIKIDCIS